jgi:excinuclease ABC subunit A
LRGYGPTRFSFNTPGGRCAGCEGQGVKRIEMSFLPDVKVLCESCGGQRFGTETLAVQFKGKSIGDVLSMSVDDAVEFFAAHRAIHHALRLLQDVGLGYLTLGQQSSTLSGGEAQRIKLVTELSRVRPELPKGAADAARPKGVTDEARLDIQTRKKKSAKSRLASSLESSLARFSSRANCATLYVLDEPTVGLHMADVEKLVRVLHRLVDAGNTVVVIEHNLDVMAEADWIIDLGPEGGTAGGSVVAQGPPEKIALRVSRSRTAAVLAPFLAERSVIS